MGEEKERLRDQAIREAEALLYGVGRFEPTYAGDMAAASAHATLAAYWQARIEWEHGVAGLDAPPHDDPSPVERLGSDRDGRSRWRRVVTEALFRCPRCEAVYPEPTTCRGYEGSHDGPHHPKTALAASGVTEPGTPTQDKDSGDEPSPSVAEVPAGYPSPCYEDCWTERECPDCHRDMNPRGRSAPLEMCCLRDRCPADDSRMNPRHLWGADDEERYRFWNEDGTPNADALDFYSRRAASTTDDGRPSSPDSGSSGEPGTPQGQP